MGRSVRRLGAPPARAADSSKFAGNALAHSERSGAHRDIYAWVKVFSGPMLSGFARRAEARRHQYRSGAEDRLRGRCARSSSRSAPRPFVTGRDSHRPLKRTILMRRPYAPPLCAALMRRPYAPPLCAALMRRPYAPPLCAALMRRPFVRARASARSRARRWRASGHRWRRRRPRARGGRRACPGARRPGPLRHPG